MRLPPIVTSSLLSLPRRLSIAAIAGLCLLASCGKNGPSSGRSSALLITFDTTRPDAISSFGGPPGLTPNIDALAAEGVCYDRAYAVTPMTQPSHASMLTGLYPLRHLVRINGHRPLPSSAETLAETARAAGMQTAAFVSAVVLDEAFGLNQGFETYDAPDRPARGRDTGFASRTVKDVADLTLSWFEKRDHDRPFFVWVHVWEPHPPWHAPPHYLERAKNNPYHAAVAYADDEIGRLLDALEEDGTLEDTTVMLVADHGEAFGEHGEFSHSSHCYESTMRVPFLIRYADGYMAGDRISTVTSVADVQPTLAEALGLNGPDNIDGRSLYRRATLDDRGAYFESYFGYMSFSWSPLSGWVDEQGKYIHSSVPELYDLDSDRGETRNLFETNPGKVTRYRDAISRVASLPVLEVGDETAIDDEMRRELEKVGYAASSVVGDALPHPLAKSDLPSPAASMEERKMSLGILALIAGGRHEEAAAACQRVLATNPGNCWALDRLAVCQISEQRWEDAIQTLQKIVENGRATVTTYGNLGGCLLSLGRNKESLASFLLGLELDPFEARSLRAVVQLLRTAGRHAEAAPYIERYEKTTGQRL